MMRQSSPQQSERVVWGRYIWVAPLAVIASIAANALIRVIVRGARMVPAEFFPLAGPQFAFLTTVGVVAGVLVFALVGWLSKRPFRTFNWIAGIALVVSWIPDIGLLVARPFPGASVVSVGTLMLMHVVAAGITVWLLNNLARAK